MLMRRKRRALALAAVATLLLPAAAWGDTSDAAAAYGVYAFGLLAGWTAMRDSISLTVYYDAPLDLSQVGRRSRFPGSSGGHMRRFTA